MSTLSRLLELLRIKLNQMLNRAEDPREALDDSYERQLDLLRGVRRSIVDVAAARKRIELQVEEMGARHRDLEAKASEAVRQNRDDLAREALRRRAGLEEQIAGLRQQYDALDEQEKKLAATQESLSGRIQAFRLEKETLKATYSASSARVRANESVIGISSELSDVGRSLETAREHIAQLDARASATDELIDSGRLTDLTAAPDSDLERQLGASTINADVEKQLSELKTELLPGSGPGPRAAGDRAIRPGGSASSARQAALTSGPYGSTS